jgi:hypothetical protein
MEATPAGAWQTDEGMMSGWMVCQQYCCSTTHQAGSWQTGVTDMDVSTQPSYWAWAWVFRPCACCFCYLLPLLLLLLSLLRQPLLLRTVRCSLLWVCCKIPVCEQTGTDHPAPGIVTNTSDGLGSNMCLHGCSQCSCTYTSSLVHPAPAAAPCSGSCSGIPVLQALNTAADLA